jgi:hypothetical protein
LKGGLLTEVHVFNMMSRLIFNKRIVEEVVHDRLFLHLV